MENKERKKLRQYEYRAKLAEAENAAIKSSRVYKAARLLGDVKNQVRSDPVSLSKKVAKVLARQPQKLLAKGKNRQMLIRSVIDQTTRYQEWILLNEPDKKELREQSEQADTFTYKPVISIITPVFNPPAYALIELIESVLDQSYPYFELCLGNFTDNEEVIEVLKRYAKSDSRIKYWQFKENRGIGENSNQILEKVSGEYVALLDHDDTLSPDALFENAKALNEKRHDFIFSDKDKIDEAGNRFDPLFKPDYSPEMMLNVNYLTHLNVMRTEVVRKVGAWDSTTDGAQDWDLFLKVADASKSVYHIPKILYHWRVIASSTALSIDTKPYALAGQRNAVDYHLKRLGIPATSYHKKTELFIGWKPENIDDDPLVVVDSYTVNDTLRIMSGVRHDAKNAQFLIVTQQGDSKSLRNSPGVLDIIGRKDYSLSGICKRLEKAKMNKNTTVLFIDDSLKMKPGWYEKLTGWLSIKDVAISSGRIVDEEDCIVDSGGVCTDGIYKPLFDDFPRYYQAYIGNAEWVRNLSVVSGLFMATSLKDVCEYNKSNPKKTIHDYMNHVVNERKQRIVMCPQVIAVTNSKERVRQSLEAIRINDFPMVDVYSNVNLSAGDPMRLYTGESLDGIDNTDIVPSSGGDKYLSDAIILAAAYDMTEAEMKRNAEVLKAKHGSTISSVAFILPSFDAVYAGLMNIFSFAEYLQEKQDLSVTFYILTASKKPSSEKKLVLEKVPALSRAQYVAITERTPITGRHDLGIATLWSTAFVLAKTDNIPRKCYFIQDNETNFYPKGSVSALVDLSYQFGFYAIANTEGLLDFYKRQYNGPGTVLQSRVSLEAYRPNDDKYAVPQKPYKVFFYARPGMPRNAFELGVAGLRVLKEQLGKDVEVITAGADWNTSEYGVEGLFTNLGRIQYSSVPELYRRVDAGLMFMFSGHPGVTASELMASGCPVVVNEYDDKTWLDLYQHEKTCLVTKPTASEIARNLRRCLEDNSLRRTLVKNGLEKTRTFYGNYESELPKTYRSIVKHFE